MNIIERAIPHVFGAEGVRAQAVKVQAEGSLSRDQVSVIKAFAEAVAGPGVDLVVRFGHTGYYAVRHGCSRFQPVHWALVYQDAADGTGTHRRYRNNTVVRPLNCKVMTGGRSVVSKGGKGCPPKSLRGQIRSGCRQGEKM